ncbi:MAG: N-6 DNA methylase, partial [Desulfovibrionaceae bacterium]|nr:N-6 DNA methylase [Desulfovibrionaceae bacterium]
LQDYFHQLLRLVYRLIFCFVAEDRRLIHAPGTPEDVQNRYQKYYSMQRLRNLARRMPGTGHADLYEGLKLTMRMFGSKEGCAGLGISPMGGFLWSPGAVPDLMDARLSNDCLLGAVRALAFISAPGTSGSSRMRPVDYRHLGARELGSVYESLLELHPEFSGKDFTICDAAGNERKKTGAYYTPAQLITSLLETALDPVIARACRSENPEGGLLSLKILDPACGSGHFLLDAARRVAERLAAQRSGDADPSPAAVQEALRDVVSRCIYGVDINPMSVELCKISLWMEAMEAGKPLSFLDHHIVCANSLLGTTPELVRKGLPDEAFAALDGDDKAAVSALKKRDRTELSLLRQEDNLFAEEYRAAVQAIHALAAAKDFDAMPSDTLEQVEAKEAAFKQYKSSDEYRKKKKLCDMWCAAFVTPKRGGSPGNTVGITQNEIRRFCTGKELPEELDALTEKAAGDYQFLHWHIAFPEVMAKGGFDVILGNPPWERIKIQEKEWFAARVPAIANALNAAERKRMIAGLNKSDPALYQAFTDALRVSAGASHFIRNSGRYPLCGCGDINMYAVFAENMRGAVNAHGRVGCIVPSGIATDDTTKRFFQNMVETKSLLSLFDFENKGIFPGVHSSYKFSLLTTGGGLAPLADAAEFVFFAHGTEEVKDPEKRFPLSLANIAQMNPNTLTCPIFRSRKDAELTKAAYRRVPVLIREEKKDAAGKVLSPERNLWGIRFNRMFDMSNDSSLFRTYAQLAEAGGELKGNRFFVEKDVCLQTEIGPLEVAEGEWLPLYEAKMVHHYSHRWATYDGEDVRDVQPNELADPEFTVQPRYWVHEGDVQNRLDSMSWKHGWLMGWRDICRSTDERTVIGAIIPAVAVGNNLPVWVSTSSIAGFLPVITSSFACDFFARFKVGGTHLNFFIAQQLAVLPPETFSQSLSWLGTPTIADYIRPRVLELTYTAWDMKPFAEELGYDGEPFPWDEARRFVLRCELDALFFHLYLPSNPDGSWKQAEGESAGEFAALKEAFPTPHDAVDYIMETFPIRKKKDTAAFGSYRTKDEILRVYDAMQAAMAHGMGKTS